MHQTVMLTEAVDALVTTCDGYYVDGTFGRGGHSKEILSRLDKGGYLLAIDKDPQAIAQARLLRSSEERFDCMQASFAQLPHQLHRLGIDVVDGILLDLGVSSPQLDDAERGFSFMQDGPLDMRMNTSTGATAAQWLSQVKLEELTQVLRDYGEEKFAKRIARAIVAQREKVAFTTTGQLAECVKVANPRWEKHKHPATRVFQAIRIVVNRELEDLSELLADSVDLLKVGGRLVVISFHSLEDRIVKRFIRRMARGDEMPRGVPITEKDLNRRLRIIGKAQRARDEEVQRNVRARSAIMRVAEKIA